MNNSLKILIISFVANFTSCITKKQQININQKVTSELIEKTFAKNGNVFYLNSSHSIHSTVWSYKDCNILIHRLEKGKVIKQDSYTSITLVDFRYDFKDEIMKTGCIVLDGGIFGFIVKKDSKTEKLGLPINIKCFTQKKYQSNLLNNIVNDINSYKMWNVFTN